MQIMNRIDWLINFDWMDFGGWQELDMDSLLDEISDISTGSLGSLCISHKYRPVHVPLDVYSDAFDAIRQKTDMVASILYEIGQLEKKGSLCIHLFSRSGH